MNAIWKFPLPVLHDFSLLMPRDARLLTVQAQADRPCLWALVDPAAPVEPRQFRMWGTGHERAEEPGAYLGTFQLDGGALVFHVFEVTG